MYCAYNNAQSRPVTRLTEFPCVDNISQLRKAFWQVYLI